MSYFGMSWHKLNLGFIIDYIHPMDMKLVSATSHRLVLHPQLYQPKTIPERPNICDIYHAQKLLEAITARLEIYTKK